MVVLAEKDGDQERTLARSSARDWQREIEGSAARSLRWLPLQRMRLTMREVSIEGVEMVEQESYCEEAKDILQSHKGGMHVGCVFDSTICRVCG
jgi:hypothetical protein